MDFSYYSKLNKFIVLNNLIKIIAWEIKEMSLKGVNEYSIAIIIIRK